MKLITLVLFITAIIIAYLICGKTEFFTPNPYMIFWKPPADDGGVPITSYDWQICSDEKCATVVDTGNVTATNALTTLLDWNKNYFIQIRANNMFGNGGWTTANVSTGDGVASISVASNFDATGKIITPLSVGPSQNIAIWTSVADISDASANLNANALVTVNRAGTNVIIERVPMYAGTKQGANYIFAGNFAAQGIPLPAIQSNDKVTAVVMVWDEKGTVQTESSFSYTVTQSVPSNVGMISLEYQKAT